MWFRSFRFSGKAGVGSIEYKPSYIFKSQTNKKTSPHAYIYEDFCSARKFHSLKIPNFEPFLKIPTRVHIRGFLLCWKISQPENPKFWAIYKNPHTRTHTRIFTYWKINQTENLKFWGFQKIPARLHIRVFLPTEKLIRLKLQ